MIKIVINVEILAQLDSIKLEQDAIIVMPHVQLVITQQRVSLAIPLKGSLPH